MFSSHTSSTMMANTMRLNLAQLVWFAFFHILPKNIWTLIFFINQTFWKRTKPVCVFQLG